jgi:hypothetical protein
VVAPGGLFSVYFGPAGGCFGNAQPGGIFFKIPPKAVAVNPRYFGYFGVTCPVAQ